MPLSACVTSIVYTHVIFHISLPSIRFTYINKRSFVVIHM